MSIWSFDLGIDPGWPQWFQEFRRTHDAELRQKAEACISGAMSDAEFKEWALASSKRHVEWLNALPLDRRAWIDDQEREDQFTVVPDGREIDMDSFRRSLGRKD